MAEHDGAAARQRTATIRIRRLSLDDGGHLDALRYDWMLTAPAASVRSAASVGVAKPRGTHPVTSA